MRERRKYIREMQERREYVRIPDDSLISYEVLNDLPTDLTVLPCRQTDVKQDTKRGETFTKDISEGGIRFFVEEFVPTNSLLNVKLTLKNTSFYFESIVRVVWNKRDDVTNEKYEVGTAFKDIPKEAEKHLIEYIKSVLKIWE